VVLIEECNILLFQIRPLHLEGSFNRLWNIKNHSVLSKQSAAVEIPDSADVVIIGKYL
jgi:hypothetical protein